MSLDFSLIECGKCVFDTNFTHNVALMWEKARVYNALYNSEGKTAFSITEDLCYGVLSMIQNKDGYELLNASNGWGTYKHALPWLIKVYQACLKHPNAIIEVSK